MKLKIPPVLLFLIATALMWCISHLEVLTLPKSPVLAVVVSGAVVIALGGSVLRQADTTSNYAAPEQSNELVAKGIYRHTRNPMYLGFALMLSGWAVWLLQGLVWLLVAGFVIYIQQFQILSEKRVLSEKFGQHYRDYCRKTQRWL
ncbi:methyltransferase family protein [Neisseria yangbaofengii]|uniref:methyltransferase family protein n=1 Tax=Neisseria yangbaofengii TaxID=2709396 RepID=UPI0013ED9761|nr:isoprenylcysteine carboxylmethyltransferase family protein [Neisseria yangbaofengii]